jgi:REP element-mobilizing transposase RayT
LALHPVWGCYGFWLPNEPRGSWSTYVASRAIFDAGGKATTVSGTRSYARDPHDHQKRVAAKEAMAAAPVKLNGKQARAAAIGIMSDATRAGYTLHALCVMPDHVHLVMLNPGGDAKLVLRRLKSGATRRLNAEAPLQDVKTPWVAGGWFVSLESDQAIRRAIHYVEQNPMKAGLSSPWWKW